VEIGGDASNPAILTGAVAGSLIGAGLAGLSLAGAVFGGWALAGAAPAEGAFWEIAGCGLPIADWTGSTLAEGTS
jgi:hypothetical protein